MTKKDPSRVVLESGKIGASDDTDVPTLAASPPPVPAFRLKAYQNAIMYLTWPDGTPGVINLASSPQPARVAGQSVVIPVATSEELERLYLSNPTHAELIEAPEDYPDRWPDMGIASTAGCGAC